MIYRNTLFSTCALALTVAAVSAHAQGVAPVANPTERGAVQELVVTANRAPVRLDQVGQSLTVLNQQAIEASQATELTELLAQTPGVTFARNGGVGKSTSVFIRGAETGQTVILYDGVRLNDPSSTDSGASLSDILSADIARVEVLRGAQSTLYGSQAIGGVINIITQAPTRPLELNGQAEGGSLATASVRTSAGGKMDKLTWRLGGSYFTTAGVSAYAAGTEADGYNNRTIDGRVGYDLTSHVALDLRAFYTVGHNDFDAFNGDAPVYGVNRQLLSYNGLNFDLGDRLKNRIAYALSDVNHVNYDETAARKAQPLTFDAHGRTDRYEYQGNFKLNDAWQGVFGVEDEETSMRTASPSVAIPHPAPITAKDSTQGYYAQAEGEVIKGLTLTGGARYERQSVFGGHTVGSASGAYSINDGQTVLRASWAQGFKAPSLYQLYSQYGNAALNPEVAESWDVGIEHHLMANLSVSAVYFSRDTTNLIIFNSCTSATAGNPLCRAPRTGFYSNVGKVHAEGEEFGAGVSFGAFAASANYTHLHAVNATPAGDLNKGKLLARRPSDAANATVSYTWPVKLATAVSVRYAGDSFNDAGNTQVLKTYTLVDFRVTYPVTPRFDVYARVENATDAVYQTTLGYGVNPRTVYSGVRFRF